MQKSKMGISVGLLGAAIYFSGLFDGMLAMAIIAGYVLLIEENQWLRRTGVKAVALYIIFALVSALIGLLPDSISFISSLLTIFGGSLSIPFIHNLSNFLHDGLLLIKTILFIILGIKSLNQSTVVIPFVDNLVNKHI
ncbi:MAG: hypothetical protein PUC88_04735 [Clostridia bacterium]|nr:hypothetical protein [Clostridia bacterium]